MDEHIKELYEFMDGVMDSKVSSANTMLSCIGFKYECTIEQR